MPSLSIWNNGIMEIMGYNSYIDAVVRIW